MDLSNVRKEIDGIDNQIIKLFEKRMELVAKVADYKKTNKMPVLSTKREQEVLDNISVLVKDDMLVYARMLYNTLFDISRTYQFKCLRENTHGEKEIK